MSAEDPLARAGKDPAGQASNSPARREHDRRGREPLLARELVRPVKERDTTATAVRRFTSTDKPMKGTKVSPRELFVLVGSGEPGRFGVDRGSRDLLARDWVIRGANSDLESKGSMIKLVGRGLDDAHFPKESAEAVACLPGKWNTVGWEIAITPEDARFQALEDTAQKHKQLVAMNARDEEARKGARLDFAEFEGNPRAQEKGGESQKGAKLPTLRQEQGGAERVAGSIGEVCTHRDCHKNAQMVAGSFSDVREQPLTTSRLRSGPLPVPARATGLGSQKETTGHRGAIAFFAEAIPRFQAWLEHGYLETSLDRENVPESERATIREAAKSILEQRVQPLSHALARADESYNRQLWDTYAKIYAQPHLRRAFSRMFNANEYASPEVGDMLSIINRDTEAGMVKKGGGEMWNFHWSGVILVDSGDHAVLEDFAGDLQQGAIETKHWFFDIYGRAEGSFFEAYEKDPHTGESPLALGFRTTRPGEDPFVAPDERVRAEHQKELKRLKDEQLQMEATAAYEAASQLGVDLTQYSVPAMVADPAKVLALRDEIARKRLEQALGEHAVLAARLAQLGIEKGVINVGGVSGTQESSAGVGKASRTFAFGEAGDRRIFDTKDDLIKALADDASLRDAVDGAIKSVEEKREAAAKVKGEIESLIRTAINSQVIVRGDEHGEETDEAMAKYWVFRRGTTGQVVFPVGTAVEWLADRQHASVLMQIYADIAHVRIAEQAKEERKNLEQRARAAVARAKAKSIVTVKGPTHFYDNKSYNKLPEFLKFLADNPAELHELEMKAPLQKIVS